MEDKTAQQAQEHSKYSASDANKNNQKQNANPPGKTPKEGKDPMSGDSDTGV